MKPASERIREAMDSRGWSREHTAVLLAEDVGALDCLLCEALRVSPRMAQKLAAAFGGSPEEWMDHYPSSAGREAFVRAHLGMCLIDARMEKAATPDERDILRNLRDLFAQIQKLPL